MACRDCCWASASATAAAWLARCLASASATAAAWALAGSEPVLVELLVVVVEEVVEEEEEGAAGVESDPRGTDWMTADWRTDWMTKGLALSCLGGGRERLSMMSDMACWA